MNRIGKELRRAGIYCIINTVNQKKYVGSSKNLQMRLMQHRSRLRKNVHDNIKLQRSWNKYGEANFQFYILEFCEEEQLSNREQFYIDSMKPWFNVILEVERVSIPKESRAKMSKSRKEGISNGTIELYQEKPIYQYSLDGDFIAEYPSIKQAAIACDINRSSINRFLSSIYKKGGNFLWSLIKVDKMSPYIKDKKDNSHFNKPVRVTNIKTGEIMDYPSIKKFCSTLGIPQGNIYYALKNKYPYLKKYMIEYIMPCN